MSFIDRQTLCLAGSKTGLATHAGEEDFARRLRSNYQPEESNVAEQLIQLKAELNKLDGEAFWSKLMTGMTDSCHAQFAFVSRRVLFDDQTTAVEMPKIGEVGSCLMATAFYYNDGQSKVGLLHDYKYHAWSCPCAHMKHDKVFLIAEDLMNFIQDNPNTLPLDCQSYLGVPLFAEGKCFAHFGMLWTAEGMMKKQKLSWAFIEMFMHSLEDLITKKLLAGQGFAKPAPRIQREQSRIIPESAITATQSLKVYAKSLSHELRTPMQGVVGMLDLMYATVQEQIEGENDQVIRNTFKSLKESIEIVQDSSKRAIEAADNVVHAYDMNMHVPETPTGDLETPSSNGAGGSYFDARPTMTEGSRIVNPHKRKRSMGSAQESHHAIKHRNMRTSPRNDLTLATSPVRASVDFEEVSPTRRTSPEIAAMKTPNTISLPRPPSFLQADVDTPVTTPSVRQSNIREMLPIIINDSLRVGGRPDFAVSEPMPLGERIEVKTRSSNGVSSSKLVEWSVDPDVPYIVPVDERDLTKLVGAVFLNALKFTDSGEIDVRVRLSGSNRAVLINVTDTGSGIPETFRPELFKAFSKEETSITRTKEGLGLGLMVAKGLVRRIGGDLYLVRTATAGPEHGSEFEIRIPLEPGADTPSRASTPSRQIHEGTTSRAAAPTSVPDNFRTQSTSPKMRLMSPLEPTSPKVTNRRSKTAERELKEEEKAVGPTPNRSSSIHRRVSSTPKLNPKLDRQLGQKFPLTFLVADDNKINRKLLVQMLNKLGYQDVHEAYDGKEAVRVVQKLVNDKAAKKRQRSNTNTIPPSSSAVDVILMDLWMPEMDGYEATEHILKMFKPQIHIDGVVEVDLPILSIGMSPTVLAVSADVTDEAIDRATQIGMAGYMSKPFKVMDLQKLILECCATRFGAPVAPTQA